MRRVDELAAIGADVREAQRRHVQILAAAHEGIGRRRAVGPPCKLRLCGSLLCNAVAATEGSSVPIAGWRQGP
jgi:hypothetical protein